MKCKHVVTLPPGETIVSTTGAYQCPYCVIDGLRGDLNAKSRELEEARKDAERFQAWFGSDAEVVYEAIRIHMSIPGESTLDTWRQAIDSALHHDGK